MSYTNSAQMIMNLQPLAIQSGGYGMGMKIHVDSFKDWRDGNPEELLRFGHIASPYERQRLADEKAGKIEQQTPSRIAGRAYG
jgi:hypothetical protein